MPRQQISDTYIFDLINDEAWEKVSDAFAACHPADIADIINRAPRDSHEQLFSLLNDEIKPDVLAELKSITGAKVPLIFNKLHIDPAVASGPFISTANDISALLIYFGVTVLLFQVFV